MRKSLAFSLKCLLVLLPLVCIVTYIKMSLLSFADLEIPNYLWNKRFCGITQEKNYDTVILGDSGANAAYMPEVLSSATINLSLGGTTPAENYYVMKNYLKNNSAPKDVFVSFIDFHMATSDCFWTRTMYSHLLSPEQNWEILQRAKTLREKSIATNSANVDFVSYGVYLPNKYITSLTNASINQRLEGNKLAYNKDSLHRGRYIAVGNNEGKFDSVTYSEFLVAPLFDYYYRELIKMCLEKGIRVHLVKLPLPESAEFAESYIQDFSNYYSALQNDYPTVTVDWLKDKYASSCFVDTSHMNTHGAFQFSRQLRAEYPDAFQSEMDDIQINCLNQDIKDENRLDEMFKWASTGPYTLLVYDGCGDFENLYNEKYAQDALLVKKPAVNVRNNLPVYVLGISEDASKFHTIVKEETGLAVYADKSTNETSKYSWNPFDVSGLDIIVINNVDGSVVTEKKFDYIESANFVLRP